MRFTRLVLAVTAVAALALPATASASHARKHHGGVLVAHKRHGADRVTGHR